LSWLFADFGQCTEWQSVQETPRRSWALPYHVGWWDFSWHPRHVLLMSAAFLVFIEMVSTGPGSPFSRLDFRCDATSLPWHEAHCASSPACGVVSNLVNTFS
jgi:hypothetical protein